jgi:short-subunit dehydrogenase
MTYVESEYARIRRCAYCSSAFKGSVLELGGTVQVHGKVILVTGAGSGIGRELALLLLQLGSQVAGIDLNSEALKETTKLAGARGDRFLAHAIDVSDKNAIESLPKVVTSRFGTIDGIINNAGVIQPFVKLNDLDYSVITKIMNVNFFGTLFVTKTFLPILLTRPEAHIVNVSSMGGLVPFPGQTLYGAAKAAVKLMSEGLAGELMDSNVRVSVVIPGAVATNIMGNSGLATPAIPEGNATRGAIKALTASDAAKAIVRGMERNDYHILVGKDVKFIDKLYRLRPAFAARTLAKQMKSMIVDPLKNNDI